MVTCLLAKRWRRQSEGSIAPQNQYKIFSPYIHIMHNSQKIKKIKIKVWKQWAFPHGNTEAQFSLSSLFYSRHEILLMLYIFQHILILHALLSTSHSNSKQILSTFGCPMQDVLKKSTFSEWASSSPLWGFTCFIFVKASKQEKPKTFHHIWRVSSS